VMGPTSVPIAVHDKGPFRSELPIREALA